MGDFLQDVLLVFNVVHVLAIYDLRLFHSLHSVLDDLVALGPRYSNISKGTYESRLEALVNRSGIKLEMVACQVTSTQ